jgi:hypothetical protein
MTFLLLLASIPHVGGEPSAWSDVIGDKSVQYRWSRPANNACNIEFQEEPSKKRTGKNPSTFVITVQAHPANYRMTRPESGQEHLVSREVEIQVPATASGLHHIEPCAGITQVRLASSKPAAGK